jgi:hypothetical protein
MGNTCRPLIHPYAPDRLVWELVVTAVCDEGWWKEHTTTSCQPVPTHESTALRCMYSDRQNLVSTENLETFTGYDVARPLIGQPLRETAKTSRLPLWIPTFSPNSSRQRTPEHATSQSPILPTGTGLYYLVLSGIRNQNKPRPSFRTPPLKLGRSLRSPHCLAAFTSTVFLRSHLTACCINRQYGEQTAGGRPVSVHRQCYSCCPREEAAS